MSTLVWYAVVCCSLLVTGVLGGTPVPVMVPIVIPCPRESGRGILVVCRAEPELEVAGILPGIACVRILAEEESDIGGSGNIDEVDGRSIGDSEVGSDFTGVSWAAAASCCCCCSCCNWRSCR